MWWFSPGQLKYVPGVEGIPSGDPLRINALPRKGTHTVLKVALLSILHADWCTPATTSTIIYKTREILFLPA